MDLNSIFSMHNILKEQITKHLGESHELTLELQAFLAAVNTEYIKATNEKEKLESLKKQEALNKFNSFRGAIEEATMVVHLDPKGKLIFVNKNFCDLSGFGSEEICGRSINDILSLYHSQKIEKIVQQLQKGSSWKGELSFIGRYNQKIWLHSTVVTVKDLNGNLEGYMAILNDITARKIFEEEIVNSENKYKHVVNSIKEIIFQIDISGDWTFLNKAWTEITEYNIIESVGLNYIDFIHSEDKIGVTECFQLLINGKIEISSCAIRIKTKSGNYKTCDVFARTIHDENGQIIGITGTINDVTEKRRNEALLIKSYAFQRAILDSAKQAIISTDQDGIIRTFNSGAEQILGYSQEKLINQKNIDILFDPEIIKKHQHLHPENSENTNVWFTGLLHESTGDSAEEREQILVSEDRKIIPVMLSLTAIRDHVGEVSGYLFIANDVTQRKKAETENYKLNKILEETPDYVIYYDLNNRPLYSNRAYKEIRFENKEEETKRPLHPAWAEIIIRKKAIPFAIDNGSWKGETAILNKDGIEIPVLQLIIIHKDEHGVPVFRSSVMRDITQRKQYEHRLLQSEKRNRDLINYSQGVICTHDLEGKILSINPAGFELIGHSLAEMVGYPITQFMERENREKFAFQYLQSFGKGRTAEGVLALIHKNGSKVQLLYKNYKVSEPNGETYIIAFAQDITERLQAENELKSAKFIAEESSKAKEMFLANMSHEIRTPMNGIVGLTNLLLKSPLNEKQNQYAISVKQSAENLLVIINDILDFSKIQAGKLEINKVPFDLSNFLYNIRQTFQLEAQKKGISLITTLDDNVHPIVAGDQVRLNQILGNLISNAIKFTTKGNVTITIKRISNKEHATRLQFKISDTGIGIAEDKLKKVFQSFTQANADTSRKYGGTGLGLSIVKNLIELMGSQIKVKSSIGKGSEFCFELNLEKAEKVSLQTIDNSEVNLTGKLHNIRILLAEDNKVNQLFAHELLTDWGVQLDIVDNGSIALDHLKKTKYDLVLMDIQMPIMSGLDATYIIRNKFPESVKNIPIIAMTANAMKGDDEKFLKAGMNDVVFKPFESLELFNKISKQIIRSRPLEIIDGSLIIESLIDITKHEIKDLQFKYASLDVLSSFSRGKSSFILKMLNVIIETVPIAVKELENSIFSNDWQQVNKLSHKLIPNMNMMGNSQLELEMRWIEDHALQLRYQTKIRDKWNEIKPLNQLVLEELIIAKNHYTELEVTIGRI